MKTVVVTGASSGIGLEIARMFLAQGAEVFAVDRVDCPLSEVRFYRCDLSARDQTVALAQALCRDIDGLDVLVNNAGQMERTPLSQLTLSRWDEVLASNLTAPLILAQALAPHLAKQRGSIVNISSTRAHMSEPDTESYAASKGGLCALTHALALSLGPQVRVNSILSGWIDVAEDTLREIDHAQHPSGRVGRAEDIVRAVEFLTDPGAGFVTGIELIIDGGMTRKMIYEE